MAKPVSILFRSKLPPEDKLALRNFAARLTTEVLDGKSFTCLITNDTRLQQLNRDFLGHDYPTDVLSFPSGEDLDLGELAISLERAREQAAAASHSVNEEISILMLHGVLHLLGMDHESDRGRMRRTETKWRKHLGLPHGLIERTRK